jgi:hypothetical protein
MTRARRGGTVTCSVRRSRPPASTRTGERPWHARKRVWALAALVIVGLIATLGNSDSQPAAGATAPARSTPTATPSPTATPDPAAERASAIATADQDLRNDHYAAALAAIAVIDDPVLMDRYNRRIAWRLVKRARQSLHLHSNKHAISLASESRRYHRLPQATAIISTSNDRIAAARHARDLATCDAAEKQTVRRDASVPAGCTMFASDLAARRAAEAAERAAREAAAAVPDEPDYSDDSSDGGTGNWCGATRDGDGDGIWCEGR